MCYPTSLTTFTVWHFSGSGKNYLEQKASFSSSSSALALVCLRLTAMNEEEMMDHHLWSEFCRSLVSPDIMLTSKWPISKEHGFDPC